MKTSARLSTLLILVITLPLWAACGFFGGSEPEPEEREPVELTLLSIDVNPDTESALVDQYMLEHPWAEIKIEGLNQSPGAYLTAENPPDIMGLAPSHILNSAIGAGLVADVTDVWLQAGLLESYPASFQDLTEYDGKQYFLPVAYRWVAIYYNRDIFDQYGIVPPETWDEFIAVCDTLVANGETPLSLAGDSIFDSTLWIDYLLLRLFGPDFHREVTNGQISYEDDRIRTAFETWQLLADNGYFLNRAVTTGDLEAFTALVRSDNGQLGRQRAVMTLASPYAFDQLPAKFRDELRFFRFPIIDPSLPVGEVVPSVGYLVPANALQPLDSIEFLSYVSSAEAQAMLLQPQGSGIAWLPTNQNLDEESLSDEMQAGLALVRGADTVTQQYLLKHPFQIFPVIDRATQAFLRGVENQQVDIPKVQAQLEEMRQKGIAEGIFTN